MAAMAATGVAAMDTTARGLLMPSPRLMLLLRLAMAMVATDVDMATMAMVATVDTMARGLLMLSLRLMLLLATVTDVDIMAVVMAVDTAMVATVVVMEDTNTERGLLSPAMDPGA